MIYVVARRGPGTVNLVDVQINLTKAILIYIYIYIYIYISASDCA